MKKLTLCMLMVLFCLGSLQAQQDPQFTQYLSNQLFFNPAYAGVTGKTQATLVHRSQWAGYNPTFDDGSAPTTQVLSFSTAFPKFNSGIGIHFVNDRLGPINNVEVQLSYAYHVPLSKQSVLSFGIRGGLYTKIVDFNKFRFRDEDDPFNVEGRDAVLEPDMAIGVYYHSESLFASISTNHLTRSEFNFGDRLNQEPLANTIYLFAGYNFVFGNRKEWTLTPTFLFKTAEFAESSFDVGGIVNYDEKFWIGSTFRNEESANVLLGVNIPRRLKRKTRRVQHNIKLNYSFDYVFLGQDAKQPTSHEISISYDIPVRLPTPPAIIRSIRYR